MTNKEKSLLDRVCYVINPNGLFRGPPKSPPADVDSMTRYPYPHTPGSASGDHTPADDDEDSPRISDLDLSRVRPLAVAARRLPSEPGFVKLPPKHINGQYHYPNSQKPPTAAPPPKTPAPVPANLSPPGIPLPPYSHHTGLNLSFSGVHITLQSWLSGGEIIVLNTVPGFSPPKPTIFVGSLRLEFALPKITTTPTAGVSNDVRIVSTGNPIRAGPGEGEVVCVHLRYYGVVVLLTERGDAGEGGGGAVVSVARAPARGEREREGEGGVGRVVVGDLRLEFVGGEGEVRIGRVR